MSKRYLAREIAMKVLYARMCGGEDRIPEVLEQSELESDMSERDQAFFDALVAGVTLHREEIDAAISAHARGWQLSRIARVDLCILRIAIYELMFEQDIPVGASINEAVELAKSFGEEKSPQFINGILGAVAAELPA